MSDTMAFVYVEPQFVEPDFGVISQTVKDLSRLPFFKTDKMQSLQEKGKRVVDYTNNLGDTLRRDLPALLVKVQNNGLQNQFDDLDDIETALQDPETSDEDKQLLETEADGIQQEIQAEITRISTPFADSATEVEGIVSDIESVVIQERAEDVLADKRTQLSTLDKDVAALLDKKAQLSQQQKELRKSLAVLDEHNVANQFADYIPSSQELQGMDLKQPEVEAIKQGLELYKKMFKNISEGIKYSELAEALENVNQQVRDVNNQIAAVEAQRTDVNATIEDLSTVLQIHTKRNNLVAEIKKITNAWRLFAQQMDAIAASQPIDSQTLMNLVQKQETYLTNLTVAQNKVILR